MSRFFRRSGGGFGSLQKWRGRFSWRWDEGALIGRKFQPVTICYRLTFSEAEGFQLVTIRHRLACGAAAGFQLVTICDQLNSGTVVTRRKAHCVRPPIIFKMRSVTPFNSASISLNGRGGWKT